MFDLFYTLILIQSSVSETIQLQGRARTMGSNPIKKLWQSRQTNQPHRISLPWLLYSLGIKKRDAYK